MDGEGQLRLRSEVEDTRGLWAYGRIEVVEEPLVSMLQESEIDFVKFVTPLIVGAIDPLAVQVISLAYVYIAITALYSGGRYSGPRALVVTRR